MIDELMPDHKTVSKVNENSMTYDWTSLDIDKQNIYILATFNPISYSPICNAKLKIKTSGVEMLDIKVADIDEILSQCGNTTKALHQQLHVTYRSSLPIAKFIDFFKSHDYVTNGGGSGKIDENFLNI